MVASHETSYEQADAGRIGLERQLWESVCSGDPDCFGQIYGIDAPYVQRYLNRMTDSDTAAELCQETFFRLWAKKDTFQERGKGLLPWLYATAHNLLIDEIEEKKRTAVPMNGDVMESLPLPAIDDVEEIVLGKVALEQVLKAIRHLSRPAQSEAVIHVCLNGESLEEYAAQTGQSVAALKQQIHRARNNLRRAYGDWRAA